MTVKLTSFLVGLAGIAACLFLLSVGPEESQKSLLLTPLSPERLLQHAERQFLDTGRYPNQISQIIFERDSRIETARVSLTLDALSDLEFNKAISLFIPLFKTDRKNYRTYSLLLAEIVNRHGLHDLIVPHLQDNPFWAGSYLSAILNHRHSSFEHLYPSFDYSTSSQRLLLKEITEHQSLEESYHAFQYFTRDEIQSVPFDKKFQKLNGPTPFNWMLSRGAEFQREGGLSVYFSGRGSPIFVRQTFPIIQGKLALSVMSSGYGSEDAGYFRWTIKCNHNNKLLAQGEVKELNDIQAYFSLKFDNEDEECTYAKISLSGVPGKFPRGAYLLVESIEIESLDNAL